MKAMKKALIITLVMVMGAVLHGQAFARGGFGRGMGQGQALNTDTSNIQNPGFVRGSGPVVNILEGETVELTGTIYEIAYYGQGVQIDLGGEIETVYGLGPVWYWEQLEASYPVVGDEITVNCSKVTFSDGTEKNIILSVITSDDEIALRDLETGYPLWRNQGFRGNGSNFPCRALPVTPEVTE